MEPAPPLPPPRQHRHPDLLDHLRARLPDIFTCQLRIYFIFCLVQLFADSEELHLPLLVVDLLSAGVAIAFAGKAITSETPSYLLPIYYMAIFECLRFSFYTIVTMAHKKWDFLNPNWLPFRLPDGVGTFIYGTASLYFSIFMLASLHMKDSFAKRREQERRVQLRLAALDAAAHQRYEETEPTEETDSPPRYSEVIREPPEDVVTAKEETSPPRYSQLSGLYDN